MTIKIKNTLKELIKENRLEGALKLLDGYASKESKKYDLLIRIWRRFNSAKEEKISGTISNSEADVKINKVANDLLDYVNSLECSREDNSGLMFNEGKSPKMGFIEDFKNFYKNSNSQIRKNADLNVWEFILKVNADIFELKRKLDSSRDENSSHIVQKNFEDPDFIKSFEEAMKISSKTKEYSKKEILSKIIIQRLQSETESFDAILTKKALEVIEFLTSHQLKILSYIAIIHFIDNNKKTIDFSKISENEYQDYLEKNLTHFRPNEVDPASIGYLEELNLIQIKNSYRVPNSVLFPTYFDDKLSKAFYATEVGKKFDSDWRSTKLSTLSLTTTGRFLCNILIDINKVYVFV